MSELWPAERGITWTLKTEGAGDPLAPLIAAQEIAAALGTSGAVIPDRPPEQGVWDSETLVTGKRLKVVNALIKAKETNTADSTSWPDPDVLSTDEGGVSRVISWDMSKYTAGLEDQFNKGGVNFNMEYAPFNLTDKAAWQKWDGDSAFTLDGSGLPVWIIRGRLNNEAQDGKTTFDALDPDSSGNGAAAFKVKQRYWVAQSEFKWPYMEYTGSGRGTELYISRFPWMALGDAMEYYIKLSNTVTVGIDDSSIQLYFSYFTEGFPLTVFHIWDAYEGRVLSLYEGGCLLEWEIVWDKSGILAWKKGNVLRDDNPNGMTSETLTIEKYDGGKRLRFSGEYSPLVDSGQD